MRRIELTFLMTAALFAACGKTSESGSGTPGPVGGSAAPNPFGTGGTTVGTGGSPIVTGASGGNGAGGTGGVGPVASGAMGGAGGAMALGTGGVTGTGGRATGTGGVGGIGGAGGMLGTGGIAGTGGAMGAAGNGSCTPNLTCTLAAPMSTGDPKQDCVDRINQFRTQCACLPALARWNDGEACADMMAQYDSTMPMTAHAGFMAKICAGGSAQDECPGWGSTSMIVSSCLQGMWSEGPPPMTPCTGTCYQQHGHFINMSNTSYTKVACGYFTASSGKIWAVQNFSR